jgi:hypothetical protein
MTQNKNVIFTASSRVWAALIALIMMLTLMAPVDSHAAGKAKSGNAYAKSIKTSAGKLTPKFNKKKNSYVVKLKAGQASAKITFTKAHKKAKLYVKNNKGKYKFVKGSKVKMVVKVGKGSSKKVSLRIVAENKKNRKTYTVTVKREATASGSPATPPSPGASGAAGSLVSRLAELDKNLYVYRDFADGFNNFTQKAWMGDNAANVPKMNEAATPGYAGVSGLAAEIDFRRHSWGGYMFLNGSLKAGETQPDPDFGKTECGLDLTGASRLVFYAKGETGKEKVEFFMGGMGWNGNQKTSKYPDSTKKVTLGVVSLKKTWTKYEINLSGKDLSRIGCGFGWVASNLYNDVSKVKFSLDDIHYEFPKARTGPVFLQSYASAKPGTDDSIINNFAYLYDNAAAALTLSYAGEHARARQIADAIVYALNNDRFYTDGRMRNAYSAGDPRSFKGWFSRNEKGAGKAFARMPGFYDRADGEWYEDYYAVSSATGNMAWAVTALCEVYRNAPKRTEYLNAARKVGDFILTLKDDKGAGGFLAGYEDWEGRAFPARYKSTEHNIDLITVYGLLAKLTREKKYADAAAHAKEFVLAMYDAKKHCFYTGTAEDGVTISKEVLPLDCNTWAILALGDSFKDGAKVMAFVEQSMRVAGKPGYDFNQDKDGVWFEGTAQAALAYKQIGATAKYKEIMAYLNANALKDGSLFAADRNGVTTGFIVSGTNIPWKYGKRTHVGATAWLAFAQMGRNPFEVL